MGEKELMRLEGWEARLAGAVELARARPYQLGEHDCFRFACAALEALTGEDRWPAWRGKYATRREALRLLAEYGGSFAAAFTRFFGVETAPMPRARRGDVCQYQDAGGELHLVVCMGAAVAGLVEAGLIFLPRSSCAHCWRIG